MTYPFDKQQFLKFDCSEFSNPTVKKIFPISDGELIFYPDFFNETESNAFFDQLFHQTQWDQDPIKLFNKEMLIPRLNAWYGERAYTYSNIYKDALVWTPTLKEIKEKIEALVKVKFQGVLLNLYRDGKDGVSWHSDDEKELGTNPTIASVSFGATRRFQMKHKFQSEIEKFSLELTHGSLLLMQGTTQSYWYHQIPKTSKPIGPRINLTFRTMR